MMDKDLKVKWLKALRSGKYKQAKFSLHSKHHDGYCCLGVLCEVAKIPSKLGAFEDKLYLFEPSKFSTSTYDNWLSASIPNDAFGITRDQMYHLMDMNDKESKKFPEIATFIENNL